MSFSSGVFTLVAGNPVVTGTTVSSTWANNTLTDIATGLSTCLLKDGTQTTTATILFANSFNINSGKFTVDAATGDITASGTLAVTGASTLAVGAGAATIQPSGLVYQNTAVTGVGNGADNTDDTLFTYSLPLNSLSANGKAVRVHSWGLTAANGNLKSFDFWFAGTDVTPPGWKGSAFNGEYLDILMTVIRVNATTVSVAFSGTTSATIKNYALPQLTVADLSANASIIKCTGKSGSSAANDILAYGMTVEFLN